MVTRWFARLMFVAALIYAVWYVYSNWIGITPMKFANVKLEINHGHSETMANAMEIYANAPPGATGYPGTMKIHPKANTPGHYVVDWTVKGKQYVFDWGAKTATAANQNATLMMRSVRK
jgi:predicted aspartyl protease